MSTAVSHSHSRAHYITLHDHARSMARTQVAESAFSFLHMELVQLALGPQAGNNNTAPTTSQLQHASRKIEAIGFQVGVRLVERYTKDRPRFGDTLEIIKFICKDFWMEVYRKQIDKLQTNNRVSTGVHDIIREPCNELA